jgi:hypothetical protein
MTNAKATNSSCSVMAGEARYSRKVTNPCTVISSIEQKFTKKKETHDQRVSQGERKNNEDIMFA